MGYELDVRDDHAQTVEESAESNFSTPLDSSPKLNRPLQRKDSIPSAKTDTKPKATTPHHRHTRNKSITSKSQLKKSEPNSASNTPTLKKSHHSYHHRNSSTTTTNSNLNGPTRRSATKNKKDVWGVGKTGSTLSYILRAGLFALGLSNKEGQPSIVLVTDGVVKSNIQDESVIRQLTAENVTCSIVQIAQDKTFFPGLNFGFVPDNEILNYLTVATNGSFLFAENCPLIAKKGTTEVVPDQPNMYHHRLLLKEVFLDKVNASRQSRKNKDGNNNNGNHNKTEENHHDTSTTEISHHDHRVFPWDPISHPIVEDIGICKYKEYFLPAECWHFMRARLRQGFMLYSVALIDKAKENGIKTTTTNGVKSVRRKVDEDSISNNFQKKESVVIVFLLHWQPNITVEYRIKSLWTSSLRHYLKTISMAQESLVDLPEEPHILADDNIFTCMRAPRAQIFIKSTASFTHMLSNWDQLQRRNQMMAVQGGKSSIDLTGAPGFIKVGKMKKLLERLFETDGMLKQLIQFNLPDKTSAQNTTESIIKGGALGSSFYMTKPSSSVEWSSRTSYIQKFSSQWAKLDRSELRVFNMCWYDEEFFNLIIGSSLTPLNINGYRLDEANTIGAEYDEVQVALNQIYAKLEEWSTFTSEDQQVFIKILNLSETNHYKKPSLSDKKLSFNAPTSFKRQIVPQFCELRVLRETDKVLCVKLNFFNVHMDERKKVKQELQEALDTSAVLGDEQNQTLVSLEIKSPTMDLLGIESQTDFLASVTVTKRPLSVLLMRDGAHFLPTSTEFKNGKLSNIAQGIVEGSLASKSTWFINPAMILTGEFIVQNYLIQYTWHWDVREILNNQTNHPYQTSLLNLAFEHITLARLEQVNHKEVSVSLLENLTKRF